MQPKVAKGFSVVSLERRSVYNIIVARPALKTVPGEKVSIKYRVLVGLHSVDIEGKPAMG